MSEAAEARLLYRFGFLCFEATGEASQRPEGVPEHWPKATFGDLTVWHHPETALTVHRGDAVAVVVGEVFSVRPGVTVDETLARAATASDDLQLTDAVNDLGGRFAVLLIARWGRRLLHDAFGSRAIFYAAGDRLRAGSHAELVASAAGRPRSEQMEWFTAQPGYTERGVRYLPGDLTMYDGVFGLAPNNAYDIDRSRTLRYWPRTLRRESTFEDLFSAIDDQVKGFSGWLEQRPPPILGLTGGIDTRVLLAALQHHGRPVRGVTWLRWYLPPGEQPTVRAVVEHTGIDHDTVDPGAELSDDHGSVLQIVTRNSGNYRRPSSLTANMFVRYGDYGGPFVRGYGGEIVRGFYNLRRRPLENASAAEMFRTYNDTKNRSTPVEYDRVAIDAFEGFLHRANYGPAVTESGYDINDIFYWEHRMGMWAAGMHNEMDAASYSLTGINSRAIYEAAFGMQPAQRLTKLLLLEVVRRYDPALAEIPYH